MPEPVTRIYGVAGLDCADCARTVEKGVAGLPGVRAARVDFTAAKLYLEGPVALDVVQARVAALGYRLELPAPRAAGQPAGALARFWLYLLGRLETRLALAGGLGLGLAWLAERLGGPAPLVQGLLLAALAVAGYPIARSGLTALVLTREFTINLLMTIAAVGAVIIGEPWEAAALIVLFALAEALEGFTADRARDSVRALADLAPARAVRLEAGREVEVAVAALAVDDHVLVRPGERLPADGVVAAGRSAVNQAPITGESLPVDKAPGDGVYAGTVNGDGALEVRVTRPAAESTLSRIIHLMETSQAARAPSQRLIDRFARVYTPAVVGLAALVAVVPPLAFGQPFWNTGTEHGWLYRALALLVIACPCALVISAPVTVISALTAAARRGVLIKGGRHLEQLASVRAFAFDKTGTLTRGEPALTAARAVECVDTARCAHCDDVLALATALERRSAHPLARAVVTAAAERGLADIYAPADEVRTLTGRGLQGRVNGKSATLGSHALFEAEHPHGEALCAWVRAAEADGQTTLLVCDGDRVRGFIAVADQVRAESRATVAELKALGCAAIMLTGDSAPVAQAVAAQVGLDDARASLLPEDKHAAVQRLRAEFGAVGMVGDGVNDAPALAAADVGIAVGGAASAQAVETADIVLMAADLRPLPYAVRLARFTRRLILTNIAISLGLKLAFLGLALAGWTSLWLAVLADMGVSLLVTANGLRARGFEPEPV